MLGPPTRSRHGSRITSASPLLGRGDPLALSHRYSSLELPDQAQSDARLASEGDIPGLDDDGLPQGGETNVSDNAEFQLYRPAAAVNTQTAANSQWLAAALDSEANNFLAFLSAEIDAQRQQLKNGGDKNGSGVEKVSFATLLPPDQHSKAVAAQGLLHVLTLATKGAIEVHQAEPFASIDMGLVREVG
jgi:meiotic recombination protein REC8, fungi type